MVTRFIFVVTFTLALVLGIECADVAPAPAPARTPLLKIVQEKVQNIKNSKFLIPAAIGRFVAVVALHPLDSLKTRVQTVSTLSHKTKEIAGFRGGGLLDGLFPAFLGHVPNGIITCTGYEVCLQLLRENVPQLGHRSRAIISAVVGDICGHVWLAPMEAFKIKLQTGRYTDLGRAFQAAVKRGPRGFYQGYTAQLARDAPYRALQLILYEEISTRWSNAKKSRLDIRETMAAGMAAAGLSRLVTMPLDVARSRMMSSSYVARAGLLGALRTPMVVERCSAYAASVIPAVVFVGSYSALFFFVHETSTKYWKKLQDVTQPVPLVD